MARTVGTSSQQQAAAAAKAGAAAAAKAGAASSQKQEAPQKTQQRQLPQQQQPQPQPQQQQAAGSQKEEASQKTQQRQLPQQQPQPQPQQQQQASTGSTNRPKPKISIVGTQPQPPGQQQKPPPVGGSLGDVEDYPLITLAAPSKRLVQKVAVGKSAPAPPDKRPATAIEPATDSKPAKANKKAKKSDGEPLKVVLKQGVSNESLPSDAGSVNQGASTAETASADDAPLKQSPSGEAKGAAGLAPADGTSSEFKAAPTDSALLKRSASSESKAAPADGAPLKRTASSESKAAAGQVRRSQSALSAAASSDADQAKRGLPSAAAGQVRRSQSALSAVASSDAEQAKLGLPSAPDAVLTKSQDAAVSSAASVARAPAAAVGESAATGSTAEEDLGNLLPCTKLPRGLAVSATVTLPRPWTGPGANASGIEADSEAEAEVLLDVPALISFRALLIEQHPEAFKVQDDKATAGRSQVSGTQQTPDPLGSGDSAPGSQPDTGQPSQKGLPGPPPTLADIGRRDPLGEAIRSMENRLARQGLLAAPASILGRKAANKAGGADAEFFYDPTDAFIDDADLEEVNAYDNRRPGIKRLGSGADSQRKWRRKEGAEEDGDADGNGDGDGDGDEGSQHPEGKAERATHRLNLAAFRLSGAEVSGTSGEESGSDMDSDLEGAHRLGTKAPEDTRNWREQLGTLEKELVLVPNFALHCQPAGVGLSAPASPSRASLMPGVKAPATPGALATQTPAPQTPRPPPPTTPAASPAASQGHAMGAGAAKSPAAFAVEVSHVSSAPATQTPAGTPPPQTPRPTPPTTPAASPAASPGHATGAGAAKSPAALAVEVSHVSSDSSSVDIMDADADGADLTELRTALWDFGTSVEQAARRRPRSSMQDAVEASIRAVWRRLPGLLRPVTSGPRPLRWKLHALEPYTADARYPGDVFPWDHVEEVAWGRYLWRLVKTAAPKIGRSSFVRRFVNAVREPQRELMGEAIAAMRRQLRGAYIGSMRGVIEAAVKRWQSEEDNKAKKNHLQALYPLAGTLKNLQRCWCRQRFWEEQRKTFRLRAPVRRLTQALLPCFSIYVVKHVNDFVMLSLPMDMTMALVRDLILFARPKKYRDSRTANKRCIIPTGYFLPLRLPVRIFIRLGEHKIEGSLQAVYTLNRQSVRIGDKHYKSMMQAAQEAIKELKEKDPRICVPPRLRNCLCQKHGAWTLWRFNCKMKIMPLTWALKLAFRRKINAFVNPANEPTCPPLVNPVNPNKDHTVLMRERNEFCSQLCVGQWVRCLYEGGQYGLPCRHYNAQIVGLKSQTDSSFRGRSIFVDVEYVHGPREEEVPVMRVKPVTIWEPDNIAAVRLGGQWWRGVVRKVIMDKDVNGMQFEVRLNDRTVTVPFCDMRQDYSRRSRKEDPLQRLKSTYPKAAPAAESKDRPQVTPTKPQQQRLLPGQHVKYMDKGCWVRGKVREDCGERVAVVTHSCSGRAGGQDVPVVVTLERDQVVKLPGKTVKIKRPSGSGLRLKQANRFRMLGVQEAPIAVTDSDD